MRDNRWKDQAVEVFKSLKEFRNFKPLGGYCTPDEYIHTLIEFIKLVYDMNAIPEDVLVTVRGLERNIDEFKESLIKLCDKIIKEVEEQNDH